MGYRSDVACVVYPDVFINPATNEEKYNMLKTLMGTRYANVMEELGNHSSWDDDRKMLQFVFNGVKWYETYDDVRVFMEFKDDVHQLGYCVEFVRIGENDDDSEVQYEGDNVAYVLGISRSISWNT
jgi:hypothetical protein